MREFSQASGSGPAAAGSRRPDAVDHLNIFADPTVHPMDADSRRQFRIYGGYQLHGAFTLGVIHDLFGLAVDDHALPVLIVRDLLSLQANTRVLFDDLVLFPFRRVDVDVSVVVGKMDRNDVWFAV